MPRHDRSILRCAVGAFVVAAQAPAPAALDSLDVLNRVSAMGSSAARFALLEFSDYQCPFCASHATTVLDAILKEYVEAGKIRYVFLNFPMEGLHPFAPRAAELAECAGRAGHFWEMHDFLFRNQSAVRAMPLAAYASALGVDGLATIEECVSSGTTARAIREDVAMGVRLGIRGTPGFVFGDIRDGKVNPIRTVSGTVPFTVFKRAIEDMLNGTMKSTSSER